MTVYLVNVFATSTVEGLFLSRVGADGLSHFYLILAAAALPITVVITRWMDRVSHLALFSTVAAVSGVSALALRFALEAGPVGQYAVYATVSIMELQFEIFVWALLADYFTTVDLKRYTVPMALAMATGGILGGGLVRLAHVVLDTPDLLLLLPALCTLLMLQIGSLRRLPRLPSDDESFGAGLADTVGRLVGLVRRYPVAGLLALNAFVMVLIQCTLEFQVFTILAEAFPDERVLTPFLGLLNACLKALEFVVAILITQRLIRWAGVGPANQAYPLAVLGAFVALTWFPGLLAGLVGAFVYRTLAYGVAHPVESLNYNGLPARWISRLRALNDGLIYPVGLAFSGALILVLRRFLLPMEIAQVGLAMSFLLLGLAIATGRAYYRSVLALVGDGSLQLPAVSDGLARLPSRHASEVNALLSSGDPSQRWLGFELARRVGVRACLEGVETVLRAGDAALCRAVLDLLAVQAPDVFEQRVEGFLSGSFPALRAAALETALRQRVLREGGQVDVSELLPLLDDPAPEVRALAYLSACWAGTTPRVLAALLVRGDRRSAAAGHVEAVLARLDSPKHALAEEVLTSASPDTRKVLLDALCRLNSGPDRTLARVAKRWLADHDPPTRRAAADLLARIGSTPDLPALTIALNDNDRAVRAAARAALSGFGHEALALLVPLVASDERRVRRSARECAAQVGGDEAFDLVSSSLAPAIAHADWILAWADRLHSAPRELHPLRVVLWDHANKAVDELLHGVSCLGFGDTVTRIRQSLAHRDARTAASMVEALSGIEETILSTRAAALIELRDAAGRPEPWPPERRQRMLEDARAGSDYWLAAAAAHTAVGLAIELSDPIDDRENAHMSRILFLKETQTFGCLNLDELAALDGAFQSQEIMDGETLFKEGGHDPTLYLVVEGTLVGSRRVGGQTVELRRFTAGDTVGEMPVLDGCPHPFSAAAVGATQLLSLREDQVRSLVEQKPAIGLALAEAVSLFARDLMARVGQ